MTKDRNARAGHPDAGRVRPGEPCFPRRRAAIYRGILATRICSEWRESRALTITLERLLDELAGVRDGVQ